MAAASGALGGSEASDVGHRAAIHVGCPEGQELREGGAGVGVLPEGDCPAAVVSHPQSQSWGLGRGDGPGRFPPSAGEETQAPRQEVLSGDTGQT